MIKRICILFLLVINASNLFAAGTKTTTSRLVYQLDFVEHRDGCYVLTNHKHYEGIGYRSTTGHSVEPTHYNDNRYVNSEIQHFKNEIHRLSAVTEERQNEVFKNKRIGGWYYVYRISKENFFYSGNPLVRGDYSANIPLYHYRIWRVDIIEK